MGALDGKRLSDQTADLVMPGIRGQGLLTVTIAGQPTLEANQRLLVWRASLAPFNAHTWRVTLRITQTFA